MRRNKSLPSEQMEKLPEISAKKDSQPSSPKELSVPTLNIQPKRIAGGLANKVGHSR
jgi:hypothetical protein